MPLTYLTRACPTCGTDSVEAGLRMASDPAAESRPFPELRDSWRGFFRDPKPIFTYVTCVECRQVFSPRYFTPAQLGELYGQMEDNTAGQDESILARTQAGYWQLLRHRAHIVPGDYLELGPDIGLFTRAAAAEPALGKFWLVEPNRAVHPQLEKAAGTKPRALLADHAQLDQIPDRSLALAVAIHVLDHLLEPQALLEKIAGKLAHGGCALVVTHNEDSLAAHVFGLRWPPFCLQHPQLYSPRTLRQAFRRAGLREVQVRRTTNYFPVPYLLRHGFFAVGLGAIHLPLPAGWTVGLKLGNIAAIGVRA